MNKLYFRTLGDFILIFFNLLTASLLGLLFREWGFSEVNVVLMFLFMVDLTAVVTKGFWQGIVASFSATFIFNYLFTSPYYTLSVDDPGYFVTFFIMTITALMTSTLTSKVKAAMLNAKKRENEMKILYELSGQLAIAQSKSQIQEAMLYSIENLLSCSCRFVATNNVNQSEHREQDNHKELRIMLKGRQHCFGTIYIPVEYQEILKNAGDLMQAILETTSMAWEQMESTQAKLNAQEMIVQERYRSSLLRSISHDLRTPLSGIIGTTEVLMDMNNQQMPQQEMLQGIYKEANWLHDLVENILNLTRLQDGQLMIKKHLEPCEEIISAAVEHILKRYGEAKIKAKVPEDLLLVPMDARLIQQVLINLMDNAILHCKKSAVIEIEVHQENQKAIFTISDEGVGIEESELKQIFKPFKTSRADCSDAKRGIGLGLTICEAIVQAHHGTITAANRADCQGAVFVFCLPLKEEEQ